MNAREEAIAEIEQHRRVCPVCTDGGAQCLTAKDMEDELPVLPPIFNNPALDVARDAWLEGRDYIDALEQVPNVVEPNTGLPLHDAWEWEMLFEEHDRRREERAAAWRRAHGLEDE